MKKLMIVATMLIIISLAACSPSMIENDPAAQDCEANGGKVEIRNVDGTSMGYCVFPDGSECSEDEYYAGECDYQQEEESLEIANPASVYCEEQGGTSELRTEDDGSVTGYCVFNDGSECEEWAYYNGECSPESEAIMKSPPEGSVEGMAFVENKELVLEEGLKVHITGNLPDPCHQLFVDIAEPDADNYIYVSTSSWYQDTGLSCVQVLKPFDVNVVIPTKGLADGVYTVVVNGEEIGSFQSTNE